MEDSKKYFYRDYNQIRPLLRSIFLYGCFAEEHYIKDSSKTTLSNRLEYIDIALPNGFVEKGERIKCQFKPDEWQDDIILNTYRFNSIAKEDLIKVYVLAMMYIDEEGISLRDFLDICSNSDFDLDIDIQTLRNYLRQMEELGLLEKDNSGRSDEFRMQKDYLKDLNLDMLESLYLLLDFLSKCSELATPYYLAKKKLALMLEERHYRSQNNVRNANPLPKLNFNFYHAFQVDALDNDVLYKSLLLINGHRKAELQIEGKYHRLIPLRIIHDAWRGRQYLAAYSEEEGKIVYIRLNVIEDVYGLEKIDDETWNGYHDLARETTDRCWSASSLNDDSEEVEIEFYEDLGSRRQGIIRTRIIREFGEEALIDNGDTYAVKLQLSDPLELLPLIRSFGENARVIKPEMLRDEVKKNWENCSKQQYGNGSRRTGIQAGTAHEERSGEELPSIFDKFENCVLELLTRLNIWSYYNEQLLDPYEKEGQLKGDLDKIKRYSLVNHFNGDYHSRIRSNDKVFKFCFDNDFFNIFDIDDEDDEVIFNDPLGEKKLMRVALTRIEKEAIVNALRDERAGLFLSDNDISKIADRFKEVMPDWQSEDIEVRHRLINPDVVFRDLHETYRILKRAIEQNKPVSYGYRSTDGEIRNNKLVYPFEFTYSVKEGVLRVIVYTPNEKDEDVQKRDFHLNNLERIIDVRQVKDADELKLRDRYRQEYARFYESVTVMVSPDEKRLEQIMRMFSYLKKDVIIRDQEIEMRLHFASSMRNSMINNLLACGDAIRMKYPKTRFSETFIGKCQKALDLYR